MDFESEVDFSEIELTIRERKIISMLMESRTRADIAGRLGISTSRVGQIINESIRPKINDWVREAPTPEQDPPAPYTQRGIS